MTGQGLLSVGLLLCMSIGSLEAFYVQDGEADKLALQDPPSIDLENLSKQEMEMLQKIKIAKRIKETLKQVKQAQGIDQVTPNLNQQIPNLDQEVLQNLVQVNFLQTLFLMANSSAVNGAQVSRAAGTLIRGLVQDQFNFGSIAAYLPRLLFLDGPTQFIETLKLIRSGQVRIPTDMDSAIDTLINFAEISRNSQVVMNVGTPFLGLFSNVFRGIELLNTELIFSVFKWFGPIGPSDISTGALEGLWNRWDLKSSTTGRPTYGVPTKPVEFQN